MYSFLFKQLCQHHLRMLYGRAAGTRCQGRAFSFLDSIGIDSPFFETERALSK